MSNNDSEVDNKVLSGLFPASCRAFVWQSGTIRNSHFLGVAYNSPQKAAAMVVVDFLISPEAQWKKMDPLVWGDGSVLSVGLLPDEWKEKFLTLPGRERVPERHVLAHYALMEPAPEYMIRLFEDFRREMIEK